MKKKTIERYSANDIIKGKSATDWAYLDKLKDEDVDTSDIPDLTEEFWKNAKLLAPARKKKMVSLRMDEEVIRWFKAQGGSYQTLMQAVLKAYAESDRRR